MNIGPVLADDQVSKVSIVGVGMRSHTGVAARMFRALADAGVNIENISSSEIVISVLVRREYGEKALRALHAAFELDKGP
jgi:aspartate kinase